MYAIVTNVRVENPTKRGSFFRRLEGHCLPGHLASLADIGWSRSPESVLQS